MLIRRFALPLAVCALALLVHGAQAQNVLVPADNNGSSYNNSTPAPLPIMPTQQGNGSGIFAPSQTDTQQPADTSPVMNNIPQAQRRAVPQPVPANQRDDFAYRTLGIEVPQGGARNGDPLANFSPEEIAIARKGFAAMEADNPQMAAQNPFRQVDAMSNSQKAQDALIARGKAACDTQSFNVLVSPQSFMQNPSAADGLNKTGVPMIGNLIQDICSDREMRAKVTNSVPMITIVQRARAPMSVDMGDGIITISADFTSDAQPQMQNIRAAFVKAVNDTDRLIQGTPDQQQPAPAGTTR